MRFNNLQVLWFLLLVPLLAAFLWWTWRKKRELMTRFIQARLLASLTVGLSPERQQLRFALLVAAVALLIVTLARPQWGFGWEESRSRGLDIIVAIDTSRSMLAEDVNPNRLRKAQLAALDLKKLAKTDRLGLVAFAGSAFLQCPLSLDDEAFRQSVNALDVNIIPQGGTALAEAIETARAAFKEGDNNDKALVLITDGEDHDGEAVAAAERAAKIGMRIFTIGVGTENGELLRIRDRSGRNEYIKDDQGNVVKSRLDEKLLQQIAQATGGFYQPLVGAHTIDWLYDRGLGLMKKSETAVQMTQRYHERYQWLLGLALLLLLTEMLVPERKSVKRANAVSLVAATAELRKAVGVLLLLALPALATASPGSAKKKYETGKFDSARRDYQELLEKKPDDPKLNYNAGTAAYQAGKLEQALKHLNAALATPEVPLQERAYYNLGNTQFRMGEEESDLKAKSAAWQEATNHYGSALKLDANDADARHNLEVVAKKLEELQKQQQQNKDQNKDQKKDDKQDDQKDQQDKQDKDKSDKQKDQQDQKSQQQQDEEKKKQEEQQKQQQEKNDQPLQDQRDPAQSQKGDQDKDGKDGEAGRTMKVMQMTPQQAMQLLDAQKSEEKALMFIPPTKTNRHDRVFKNW